MEKTSETKVYIPFYAKGRVLYTMLPYLETYQSWKKVMTMTCKKSKQIWDENQTVFKELYKSNHKNYFSRIRKFLPELSYKADSIGNNLVLSNLMGNGLNLNFMQQISKI